MKYYAGIGSRQTPKDILDIMEKIGKYLQEKNYILRSGGAIGADRAFERYVVGNKKEIFYALDACEEALAIARKIHPAPASIDSKTNKDYIWNLMARNCYQILGRDLKSPVDFVICWTPDGCETIEQRSQKTGGTGQAIHLACLHSIPVVNMKNDNWREKLIKLLKNEI